MSVRYRLGIDIGGTFTDYLLLGDDGTMALHKRLTTPANPANGALAGLEELLPPLGIEPAQLEGIVHGTTLVTNAIIERRGARTALLTTCGFRDVLEMGFEQRYDIYDLFLKFPEPIIPRRLRLEIDERISRDGEVLRAPDLDAVEAQVQALVEDGVEALAISFLHSYRNPVHERLVAERLRRAFPELWLSVSHEVAPEIREYERTNTTACNAYVQPLMARYLGDLTRGLAERGFAGTFLLLQSSGGSATPETAQRFPIRFLESGPAGGAVVTGFLGGRLGLPELLSFDMGGTTAKACLIRNGRPDIAALMEAARVHRFKPGSGLPIKAPVVDMIEIGAGGGSIARIDELGLLKVGPQSAGADPGPACYGRGGSAPTVTDACLLLGYLDPGYFLGGAMPLDAAAAERAIGRLASELGLEPLAAAWGIYEVACESMARAARLHIIEKGEDPRRFPLMAFGGAGPVHAATVARILGAPEVLVPQVSGVASALGFLAAPTSFELTRSFPGEMHALDWGAVAELLADLEARALALMAGAGVAREAVRLERFVEMRFVGQFHELDVPLPDGPVTAANKPAANGPALAEQLTARFTERYAQLYHAALPGYRAMAVNWRLRATGPEPRIALAGHEKVSATGASETGASAGDAGEALKGRRPAYLPGREQGAGQLEPVPVYDRYRLRPGHRLSGPAIIEERESTTVLMEGDELTVDASGTLRIRVAR